MRRRHRVRSMRPWPITALAATLALVVAGAIGMTVVAQVAPKPALEAQAKAALAQHSGTIMVRGLSQPVEVLRDTWGIPHIYARNTADLFFAQGFVVAQDRMWQLEMWRRNGEGRLAEVLGPDYLTRDKFARLLTFRGDWEEEFRKYHPEGKVIFSSFAAGINAAIQKAIDDKKVPVEFDILGFPPQPVWTAKTVLTRMPGWTLSRNASSEVARALDIKALGVAKVEELKPLTPRKKLEIPPGLDLADIEPAILDITRDANDIRWSLKADLGSNNWVVSGAKSATGGPILANDPHREVVNPALRYVVHLVAPGWDALGATEPGLPGVSIGHNETLAWGFTILGMDQQDLYVEETDPAAPSRYQYKGEWLDMTVERELIFVKGKPAPVEYDVKLTRPNKLYRNEGNGRHFSDVAHATGVDAIGESRQLSFVDYDNDGRVDLFVAFRDRPNMLFHNEGRRFVDVAKEVGMADPRKTVGAVWFDMDEDGDLDLFVANQDGDTNTFYRNDGKQFVDVARDLGMDGAGRPSVYGSVGPSLADFDNDGRLDLFVAGYGPSALWHNEGGGRLVDVAVRMGAAGDHHLVASNWGDYDNDGRPDLYAGGYLTGIANYGDYLYHNEGGTFSEVASGLLLKHDASHGVQWVDYDQDGALDLSLADNGTRGGHFLFHNRLPAEAARRSLRILVVNDQGHLTRAGSEVRVFAVGTRTVLATGIVDTGSGYCSQNAMPVRVGLPVAGPVDVEVTGLTTAGRKVVRTTNVDPGAFAGKSLVVRVGR